MASTAPTLTWAMTATRSPVDPTLAQDVLDALALSVGDTTTWRVVTSGAGFLEIGPVVNSPTTDDYVNFRIIIAFGINAAQRQTPHSGAAVNAGELWMGVAPEGGSVGIIGAGPLTAADPYTTRWSLFWRCSGIITGGADVDNLFCLTSDEVFSCWFNEAAPEDWWGGIAGAFIDPPTDADGEGTPGRVYGMSVSGRDILSGNFWQNTSEFLNGGTGSFDAVTGCFRPALPARWTILDRATAAAQLSPRADTEGGTRITMPVLMYQAAVTTIGSSGGVNSNNGVGILRQIRRTTDNKMRVIVQNGSAVDKSFIIASSTAADVDAASFDQG
jgi:hypothetical protein